jgi:hypothetical protein
MLRKRPCSICGRWFFPDPRVGERQRACSSAECQAKRRAKTQASWRARNRDYFAARRIKERRAEAERMPEPLCVPAPLDRLPWDVAQDEFGPQGTDFIAILGRVLLRAGQDAIRAHVAEMTEESARHQEKARKDETPAGPGWARVEAPP